MRNNPNITIEQLSGMMRISATAINNNISILKKNGYIERIESTSVVIGRSIKAFNKALKKYRSDLTESKSDTMYGDYYG